MQIILGADHHNINTGLDDAFYVLNIGLTLLFAVEVICKLVAYTNDAFWSDAFNIFDVIIVFFGLLELVRPSHYMCCSVIERRDAI